MSLKILENHLMSLKILENLLVSLKILEKPFDISENFRNRLVSLKI